MQALILAAGLGTRLGPLTSDLPKCMLQVGDRPLIEQLVRWLKQHQIHDIAINLHHRPDAITEHLGDGSRFGVQLHYSFEPTLLGTAGAAKRLESHFSGPFVVVYGDGYTNLNLARVVRIHAEHRVPARPHLTMVLFRVPNPSECGLVDLDSNGRVLRFVEKPPPEEVFTDLASAGVLIMEREILALIPPDEVMDFGRDVLPAVLTRDIPIYGVPLQDGEYLIDIGTPAAYSRASALASIATGS